MAYKAQLETITRLKEFGAVPVGSAGIKKLFEGLEYPNDKISRLYKESLLIRLKKGLYSVSPEITGMPINKKLIANYLHGPSYISLQSALYSYGLIPEAAIMMTSVTIGKSRTVNTSLGIFQYTHVDTDYYSIGIKTEAGGDVSYMSAGREKALCDLIVLTRNLRIQSRKAMIYFLENDIRFDMDQLAGFDTDIIDACIDSGTKKRELKFLKEVVSDYK